jgi:hypothetical protein
MKRVTLKFGSLQHLAECMFQLSIKRPEINYENFTLIAILSDEQINTAIACGGQVVESVPVEESN